MNSLLDLPFRFAIALAVVSPLCARPASGGGPRRIRIPADFPTIQAGIDVASDGDLVLVAPGTYAENLVLDGKAIVIASEFLITGDRKAIEQTVLDGSGGTTVWIGPNVGPGARVVGLTIQNGADGLHVYSDLSIEDNRILDNGDGIDYEHAGGACLRNVIADSGDDGIDLDGRCAVRIEGNVIADNDDDGIEIRLHAYSGPTLEIDIRRNAILRSGEDGIQLIDYPDVSSRVLRIEGNVIRESALAAIGMMGDGNTVEDLHGEPIAERIFLEGNTLVENGWGVTGGANLIALNNLFGATPGTALFNAQGASIAAYNGFWANGADHVASTVDVASTLYADPLLGSYLLLPPSSRAIDAGTAFFVWQNEVVLDLPTGQYSGVAPDLGAFERK